jgi:hypothetical protein
MPPVRLDLVGRGVSEASQVPLNGAGGHVEDEMPNEGLCQQLVARIRLFIKSRRAPRKWSKMVSETLGRQRAGPGGLSSRAA